MIFCVEDDKSIRDLVIYTLSSVGYEAAGFASGKELFAALEATVPQLIMLDIMLPEEDGLSILKKLKNDPRTEDIPVIMATAKGTEYDKVIGLDLSGRLSCKAFRNDGNDIARQSGPAQSRTEKR